MSSQQQQQRHDRSIQRLRRLVVHQHSQQVHSIADQWGLLDSRDAMCGFLAVATLLLLQDTTEDVLESPAISTNQILDCMTQQVLPWMVQRRVEYMQSHLDEFVPLGTPYNQAKGRMAMTVYRAMMASTVELVDFLAQQQHVSTVDKNTTAVLCNVVQGPPVNDESIRFPRTTEDFISHEEEIFLKDEVPFHGEDYYVRVMKDNPMRLADWCRNVVQSKLQHTILIDGHGHFLVLRITFRHCRVNDNDDDSVWTMILEEWDSMKRNEGDDEVCQPCQHLIEALTAAWNVTEKPR